MKRILSFLLMVGLFLSIAACGQKQMSEENDKNETETSSDDKINESQEDTDKIELSIDNFTDFFTYTKGLKYNGVAYYNAYTVQGVLDFAYYKDVVITFEVTYQVSENEVKTTYMTHTNAAGDVSFWEADAARSLGIATYYKIISFEVKSVSGTVHLYH